MANAFLSLQGVSKSFGGVKALQNVDLTHNYGEVHCLAGENGSGKSTLIKVISGIHEADAGSIRIEGKPVGRLRPIDAIRHGIQVIYQDFAVFPNLSVMENISMNHQLMTGAKLMNWRKSRSLALEAMQRIGAQIDPELPVERLSVANKQLVAILRAIINDAKLLILDEPTTALTAREVDMLFSTVRMLRDKGMAIMIVNHKLDEIYEIADRLTVLRNGAYVSSGMIGEYDRARFVRDLTGRDISEQKYQPDVSGGDILTVKSLTRRGSFEDVSFSLKKGEVLGITGLLGSGRGEIGDALFGVQPADSGSIALNGRDIRIRSIGDAMKNKIAYVPEDRLTQGLFLDRSILDNTVAASLPDYFHGISLDHKALLRDSEAWVEKIGVVTPSVHPPIRTLSGGNQQKVVLAKWLNTKPELLVLNGPTVGVDIGAKADIHGILRSLAADGVGIIVISDDLSELITNCNRILIMREGRLACEVNSSDCDESRLAALLSGKEGDA